MQATSFLPPQGPTGGASEHVEGTDRFFSLLALSLLALSGLGCTNPEPNEAPHVVESEAPAPVTWLDGERVLVFGSSSEGADRSESIPLGHYLGPGAVHGVGMLAGAQGVATSDDGVLWISKLEDGRVHTTTVHAGAPFGGRAVWLGVA